MLHEFLTAHRDDIVARARVKVAIRSAPRAAQPELEYGVSHFLDQLAETLRCEQTTESRQTSQEIARGAGMHGAELRRAGFTVAQVVHDYGDVCQAVTDLAIELGKPIANDEFRTLNRCLDEAIAQAVSEFGSQQERSLQERATERMGFFAHEIGNLVANATLAFEVLQTATVGVGGSTGAVLGRNLTRLRHLVDRSLAEVRLEAGLHRRELVAVSELMEEVGVAAKIEARARGLQLTVTPVEPGVVIEVDRQLMAAALANLLHNAFKFSRPQGHIVLSTDTSATDGRVLIDVEDECGGLANDVSEELFRPFQQRASNRTGLGLGLAVARQSVERNGGQIRVRSLPDHGCVFTIELPRLLVGAKEWCAPQDSNLRPTEP
jgi:signal transduction histidine kinase